MAFCTSMMTRAGRVKVSAISSRWRDVSPALFGYFHSYGPVFDCDGVVIAASRSLFRFDFQRLSRCSELVYSEALCGYGFESSKFRVLDRVDPQPAFRVRARLKQGVVEDEVG